MSVIVSREKFEDVMSRLPITTFVDWEGEGIIRYVIGATHIGHIDEAGVCHIEDNWVDREIEENMI